MQMLDRPTATDVRNVSSIIRAATLAPDYFDHQVSYDPKSRTTAGYWVCSSCSRYVSDIHALNCSLMAKLSHLGSDSRHFTVRNAPEMIYVLGENDRGLELPFVKKDGSILNNEDLQRIKQLAKSSFAAMEERDRMIDAECEWF